MPAALQFAPPAPGTLRVATKLIAVVLVVGTIATAVGGTTAGLIVGLASGASMGLGSVVSTRAALVGCIPLGAAAALGAVTQPSPLWSSLAVALMILLTVPAHALVAGMLTLAPLITLVFAVKDRGFEWWEAGVWGLVGGVIGLAIAAIMKSERHDRPTLPWSTAWHHGVVLAIGAGGSLLVAQLLELDHGYWITVTMLVVLRVEPISRTTTIVPRIAGTVGGALVAIVTIVAIPPDYRVLVGLVCLLLLAAYAMSGNYFLQTLALTPMLLIFLVGDAATDDAIQLTLARVFYTVVGVGLVAVMAWILKRWDRARP